MAKRVNYDITFLMEDDKIDIINDIISNIINKFSIDGWFGVISTDNLYTEIGKYKIGDVFQIESDRFWMVRAITDDMIYGMFILTNISKTNPNCYYVIPSDKRNFHFNKNKGILNEDNEVINHKFTYVKNVANIICGDIFYNVNKEDNDESNSDIHI